MQRSRPYLVALVALFVVALDWWLVHTTRRPQPSPAVLRGEVPDALLDRLRARGYVVGRELPDREDNRRRGWWVTVLGITPPSLAKSTAPSISRA